MRISFDLDDTLICYQAGVPREPNGVPWLFRWYVNEPLRLGAVGLMRELSAAGHELWVYTTSHRNPTAVRRWLRFHGVRIAYVVNQSRHERTIGCRGPSKDPGRFRIDLHVDDSWGVWLEGRRHWFRVAVVVPHDPDWTAKVRAAVAAVGRGGDPAAPPDLPAEYLHLAGNTSGRPDV
jgi:hypothetical protein